MLSSPIHIHAILKLDPVLSLEKLYPRNGYSYFLFHDFNKNQIKTLLPFNEEQDATERTLRRRGCGTDLV